MTYRAKVAQFIEERGLKTIAEIGVYRGVLSRLIWRLDCVENLFLVDPWSSTLNDFTYVREGEQKRYTCHGTAQNIRDDHLDSQRELDSIVNQLTADAPKKVTILRLPSQKATHAFPSEFFDLVFIDAIHLYDDVMADIRAWEKKVKPGGYVMGDDYTGRWPEVKKAVDDYCYRQRIETQFLYNQRIWYYKKLAKEVAA